MQRAQILKEKVNEENDVEGYTTPPLISEELKQTEFKKLRFAQGKQAPQLTSPRDANPFMLNTEWHQTKPPPSPTDFEVEVVPKSANSQTHYSWGFWPYKVAYTAYKALKGRSHSKWLSKQHAIDDHWEAVFAFPQKLDSMDITWTNPPERFKLYFKLDEGSKYVPLTELLSNILNLSPSFGLNRIYTESL